jgi:ribosomal protein S18 acetylase RimI-like enzyme
VATPRSSLSIRLRDNLLSSDRDQIDRISRECGYFRPEEVDVAVSLVDDRLEKGESSEYEFIVAEHGEQVVGFCCYGKIACTTHSFDIYWVVVDAMVQRTGIGRKLMDAAEDRIRQLGGSRAYIETSGQPKYDPTRRFYESCGYRAETVLKDFYAPGDDRVTYVKVLAP